jgi:hypothetical protein
LQLLQIARRAPILLTSRFGREDTKTMMRHRWMIALAAIATVFIFVAADQADARAGRGFSGGSRGMRTY